MCVIASRLNGRNNLSDHVYIFLVVLLTFKVGRNNVSGHVYVFHVVMTCYTSTCQHKTTRSCKHYHNIRVWGWGEGSIDYGSVYGTPACCDNVYMVEFFYVDMSRYDTS